MVSKGLRNWFVIHFILDVMFGIPLILAPVPILSLVGWSTIDPIMARLVGAALMGIGIESLLGRKADTQAYQGMLNLKIIWSGAAIIGFVLSILTGYQPWGIWFLLVIFAVFNVIWVYYRRQLR
jgi:hypothetical protein